jgi:acetyl esterase/lipase
MKQLTIFLLLFVLCTTHCMAQPYSKNWMDLNYTGDTLVSHRMDIYLPDLGKPFYPAVLVVYGSAFFGNDMKLIAYETLGSPLLKAGFAVVAVNHRSSRDAIFPAQIEDIQSAIRFLRTQGGQYQIDTSFIGITGYSSGGHLSAMAGTSSKEHNTSVDAVVDWFGPTDFPSMDSCGSTMVHDAPDSPESTLIGGPIQENKELCAKANPISYVDPEDPPFLILHGDADPLVPHCQSAILFQALQEAGVSSQFVLVPGGGHGPGLFEEKYFDRMCAFFLSNSQKK